MTGDLSIVDVSMSLSYRSLACYVVERRDRAGSYDVWHE